jgi:hypothetical protein
MDTDEERGQDEDSDKEAGNGIKKMMLSALTECAKT